MKIATTANKRSSIIKSQHVNPLHCLGTIAFHCDGKFDLYCSSCTRNMTKLKKMTKCLQWNGVDKTYRTNKVFLDKLKWKMPVRDALTMINWWKKESEGLDFMREIKTDIVIASSLYVTLNGEEIPNQCASFARYLGDALLLQKHFKSSPLGEHGIYVIYVNSSVPADVILQLRQAGIRVRLVDDKVMSAKVCDDKKCGPAMMRYLAFWEFMETATVVMILDADLPWLPQLEGLLFDFVYRPTLACEVLRGAFEDYFDTNQKIMGGLFGLRGEALAVIGNAIRAIIQTMADEKTTTSFAYGADQSVLAVSVFPIIKHFNALTALISSREEPKTWDSSKLADKLPTSWKFAKDSFHERRCFGKQEFMG